jgi:hypothetical protein
MYSTTTLTHSRTLGGTRALLAALALLTAVPVCAQGIVDFDEDGVADAVDACPDTDSPDLVGPDGCTIASCDDGINGAGWSSHQAYVAFIASWTKAGKAAGTLTAREARQLIRKAKNSTCGDPSRVRCCVYRDFDDDVGSCRIMTEGACDALDDRLFEQDGMADVEDSGGCLPNPCVF